MANNLFKPQGSTSASDPDRGGGVIRSVPVFAVVKDNIDPIRSGRLRVYIDDMSGHDPEDATSWVTVNYMTPFYGHTEGNAPKTGHGTYLNNSSSYGMWNSPPDIGTIVICIFINGSQNYGYWIGSAPKPEMLYMVPAIGSAENVVTNEGEANAYGGATRLPVANINRNNPAINDSAKFFDEPKPVHSYLAGVLAQQGLVRDTIRGTIGTSSQRESPSRVGWGVNTPGRPIYEGGFTDETIAEAAESDKKDKKPALKIISRRVGHSIVMDDGDLIGRDQLIRLRTSLGHQILMSDDGQTLFIIHANGQSYIELGKEGTIDMYATNSVNIRTQGDLNLHADNNININAKKDLNIYAENIKLQSDKNTDVKVGADYATNVSENHTVKVDGKMSFKSSGEASLASAAQSYINGSKVNLNSGESSLTPNEIKPFDIVAHTDTKFDKEKGWLASPASLLSIVSRAPAHAPWTGANQGVDVKIDNNAAASFPSPPSPAVAAANNGDVASQPPVSPVSPAVASTVPVTQAVSDSLDKNVTSAVVGQIATIAQSIPEVATAIQSGAGLVQQGTEKVAAVGLMGQSFQQMEASNTIKAGAAALADAQIRAGKTIEQALPSNMFTGKPGATSLNAFVNNTTAQVASVVSGLQKAQTDLTKVGMITGKEAPSQITGLITSTALGGLSQTVNMVKNAASSVTGAISGAITGVIAAPNKLLGSVASLTSAGNFASNMASNVTGGLGSIANALSGMSAAIGKGVQGLLDSAKGVAGSAFAAIKNALPKLKAGIPQNLKKISEDAINKAESAGAAASASLASVNPALDNLAAGAQTVVGSVTAAANTATSSVNSVLSGAGSPTNLVTDAQSALKSITSVPNAIASGLSGIPGAGNTISTITNKATSAINALPGVSQISGALAQVKAGLAAGEKLAGTATGMLNKLKTSGESLKSLATAGIPAGAAAALNSAIASLSSGAAVQIKLPSVGANTSNRTDITSQLSAVFGSVKIPTPNFAGNPATSGDSVAKTTVGSIQDKLDKQAALNKELEEANDAEYDAKRAYQKAKYELPAGDPQIATAKAEWDAKLTIVDTKRKDILKFITGG